MFLLKSQAYFFDRKQVEYYKWGYNDNRMVRLSIIYNFNRYKKKYNGTPSAQEEIWRM